MRVCMPQRKAGPSVALSRSPRRPPSRSFGMTRGLGVSAKSERREANREQGEDPFPISCSASAPQCEPGSAGPNSLPVCVQSRTDRWSGSRPGRTRRNPSAADGTQFR